MHWVTRPATKADGSNDMFYEGVPRQLLPIRPQPPHGPAFGHPDHSERASVSDKRQLRLLSNIQQPALPTPSISFCPPILPNQPTGTCRLKGLGDTGRAKLRKGPNTGFIYSRTRLSLARPPSTGCYGPNFPNRFSIREQPKWLKADLPPQNIELSSRPESE